MAKRFLSNSKLLISFVIICLAMLTIFASQVSADNVTYKYDELNRLSQVTYDDGTTITYTYDEAGNRLTKQVSGAPSKPMPWLPLLLDDE